MSLVVGRGGEGEVRGEGRGCKMLLLCAAMWLGARFVSRRLFSSFEREHKRARLLCIVVSVAGAFPALLG